MNKVNVQCNSMFVQQKQTNYAEPGGYWFEPPAQKIFFPRINGTHAVHYFNDIYVGKHPVTWKEYCVKYWLKESRKACVGVLAATAFNTI